MNRRKRNDNHDDGVPSKKRHLEDGKVRCFKILKLSDEKPKVLKLKPLNKIIAIIIIKLQILKSCPKSFKQILQSSLKYFHCSLFSPINRKILQIRPT